MKSAVAALLLLGVLRHYGWELVRPEWQAHVWNISGAAVIVIFLWIIAVQYRPAALVAIWWTFEELQVVACSLGRMLRPWPVKPGEAQCSALLGFDLSTVGLLLVALILVFQFVETTRKAKP